MKKISVLLLLGNESFGTFYIKLHLKDSNITIFVRIVILRIMKISEVHRIIRKNGWTCDRISGCHYIYIKDGVIEVVPFHGSKEMGEGLRKKIFKKWICIISRL